ncbi:MAG: HD domain-containing protein [Patescibacteria group bacterium]|nr:HD domain-containing protein [Patescibacteria group bacterium]
MNKEKIVSFFFEMASLRRLTRSHRQMIAAVNDNISDHSFRVGIIAMILAGLEKCDQNKALKMGLFHDLVEARTGDANTINKQYVKLDEEGAREDQLSGLPIGEEILELLREYEERKSAESIVAKDADSLDQMVLEQEYFFEDPINRKKWQDFMEKKLKTESAKKLSIEIRNSNPFNWLYQIMDEKIGH